MKAMEWFMSNILSLIVNQIVKIVDYTGLQPEHLANRHYEYIKQAKTLRFKSESSLYTEAKMILHFFAFLDLRKINDLSKFSYAYVQEFYAYLATVTSMTGKPLSKSSQRLSYTFFKNFSKWLHEEYPEEAPELSIFQKSPYRRNNDYLKTPFYSDHVLDQIKKSVLNEKDIQTKAYVMILLYYGLRSGDIVSLTRNCLTLSDKDGKYDLHYIDHKQNEKVIIPAIASPVSRVIAELIKNTHSTYKMNKTNQIFLQKDSKGFIKTLGTYQKVRLDRFTKEHNITDDAGNLAKLSSHMFRRTLATNLQSSGVSLETAQMLLNHKHKRTTAKHYIKTKSEDYIEQISKTLDHMQILASVSHVLPSNGTIKPEVALRLSDGYCSNVAMVSDESYMCEHFVKRGNCYGCSKMVTTPEFLPYFYKLVTDKEEELNTKNIYGSHVIRQIKFEMNLLKTLIGKLEELKGLL